ncbi:Ig-like domain-containing protein [Actinoallomurus purpureus]|uniref:L,D-transpeptidase n=1 Tax=Actinoallomurus purpureus TaxID=478114 RepID=UPI00209248F6|nr:Ig-like domain-containing protein [Actinoallomurus purpureus]MCO6011159.1 Ig-like domain-containing protein [Actinoallomurus purpureus]
MHVNAIRTRLVLGAVTGTTLVMAAGCGGGSRAVGESAEKVEVEAAPARVVITPADGAAVRPDEPVIVRATGGSLDAVVLASGGRRIAGTFNRDRTEWRSRWALDPGSTISVRAVARNADGRAVSAASGFRTETAAPSAVSVSQDPVLEDRRRDTYGVGLPIILNFDKPITDRAAVEKSLEVIADKPVEGAWHWFGDQQVVYRPKMFWPAHQTVRLVAHLTGVPLGKNGYGAKDFIRTYKIGREQISRLDLERHRMRVEWDGRPVRRVPISAGNGESREYTTTSGIHLNMEKDEDVWMTSPNRGPGDAGYYHELIHYAVRVSNAGEYLHQTPGQEDCLGNRNCSHGCIRQPATDAIWYYKHSQPGDPVVITGSDRQVEPDNGWSFYQMPWKKWVKGSAVHH